jgi:hypothetical protein
VLGVLRSPADALPSTASPCAQHRYQTSIAGPHDKQRRDLLKSSEKRGAAGEEAGDLGIVNRVPALGAVLAIALAS